MTALYQNMIFFFILKKPFVFGKALSFVAPMAFFPGADSLAYLFPAPTEIRGSPGGKIWSHITSNSRYTHPESGFSAHVV